MALESRYFWLVAMILSCVCLIKAEGGDRSASGAGAFVYLRSKEVS